MHLSRKPSLTTAACRSSHRPVRHHPSSASPQHHFNKRIHSLPIVRPQPGQRPQAIKTQARAATILPNFVGLRFQIHNGKIYNEVLITEDMVGRKLGEFSA